MHRQLMDKKRWSIAHDIASELVDRGTDPNEFGKVVAFMRQYRDNNDAKKRLKLLLERMANSRYSLIRSHQTQRFYRNIQDVCQKHLRNIDETKELLLLLGWSMRLMRYYRVEPKCAAEEQRTPRLRKHQRDQKELQTKVRKGQRVNAEVISYDGRTVVVRLIDNQNEEVQFQQIAPHKSGVRVKVKVQGVDNTGRVTRVIP